MRSAALAVFCAASFMALGSGQQLPGLGHIPLLPVTLLAALLGWPMLLHIQRRGIAPIRRVKPTPRPFVLVVGAGAMLALPPIAIDFVLPFPADINLPMPQSFLFYPAVALVAEVAFHLLPLTVLTRLAPSALRAGYLFVPVIFVEPLFQILSAADSRLQAALVFCSVSLVSATGLWLFRCYGFAAMLGLRIVFYLFWHILWGTARLSILF